MSMRHIRRQTWFANQSPSGQLASCLSGSSSRQRNRKIRPYTGLLLARKPSSRSSRRKNVGDNGTGRIILQECHQFIIKRDNFLNLDPFDSELAQHYIEDSLGSMSTGPWSKQRAYQQHEFAITLTGSDSSSQNPFHFCLSNTSAGLHGVAVIL